MSIWRKKANQTLVQYKTLVTICARKSRLRKNKPTSKTGDDDSTVLEILQPELAAAEEEEEEEEVLLELQRDSGLFVVLEIAEEVVLELEHIHRQTDRDT
jgi:hypothetical protein